MNHLDRRTEPVSPTYAHASHARSGFTLVEMLLVLLITIIGTYAYLVTVKPDPTRLVNDAAQELAATLTNDINSSEANGGEAVFYVDATHLTDPDHYDIRGRFLGVFGAEGVSAASFTNPEWLELRQGVQWSYGGATAGPLGDATAGAALPAEVHCRGHECSLGTRKYVTYYFGHVRDAGAVAAVTLTSDGIIHVYRYQRKTGTWNGASE